MLEYERDREIVSNSFMSVNSCGVEKHTEIDKYRLREYGRLDYHILYIYQGRCECELQNRQYIAKDGDILLYMPGEKQKYNFYAIDKTESCYLHFSGTGCEGILRQIGFSDKRILHVGKSNAIRNAFEKLSTEWILSGPYSELFCMAYLIELFAQIGKKLQIKSGATGPVYTADIERTIMLMHKNFNQSLPLSYYAKQCNLSLSRFAHIFKERMGTPPNEYINNIRIKKAKEYLKRTNLTISEISGMVGFSNSSYFGKAFKKVLNMSPSQYRHSED